MLQVEGRGGELRGGVGQRGLMKCGLVGVEMIIHRQSLLSSFKTAASNKQTSHSSSFTATINKAFMS